MSTAWPVIGTLASQQHGRGWEWVPLLEVADLVTGHTPARNKPEYWDGGISWINLNEIRELDGRVCDETELKISAEGVAHSSAVVHPAGTVCMSRTASVGFVTQMGRPMATSQDFVNWICGPEIVPEYLVKALRASRPHVLSLCSGSTHKTMYVRDAERLRVLLPPVEEQRQIAAALEAADALRDKRRHALAKLDTLTQAIFVDMFGDLSNNTRGWPVRPLGDIVAGFETGKSIAAGPDDTPGGLRVLKVSAVTSRTYLANESKPVPADHRPPQSHFVREGDLLLSRANTTELVGACAYVHSTPENHLLPDKLWRFVWSDSGRVEPLYIWRAVQDRKVRKAIEDKATGSSGSMKNISQEKFLSIDVPIPPAGLQQEFTSRFLEISQLHDHESESVSELDALFASVQQRAFRGEL